MSKLKLTTEEEKAYAATQWSVDADGERVLRGLTLAESIWYVETGRAFATLGKAAFASKSDADRYWELQDRHYRASSETQSAVDELGRENPTVN